MWNFLFGRALQKNPRKCSGKRKLIFYKTFIFHILGWVKSVTGIIFGWLSLYLKELFFYQYICTCRYRFIHSYIFLHRMSAYFLPMKINTIYILVNSVLRYRSTKFDTLLPCTVISIENHGPLPSKKNIICLKYVLQITT